MSVPVARLTDGQRDCLRLVLRHMTSKDIARQLDISPHTVDMRLRTAMRTLGVVSRIDAALLLDSTDGSYQPLIYQRPELAAAPAAGEVAASVEETSDDNAQQHPDTWPRPEAEYSAGGPPRPAEARPGEGHSGPVSLANALPWGVRNRLGPGMRLAWIAVIAIGSALGFGAILAALEALKNLL